MGPLTYVDANVLIDSASTENSPEAKRALAVVDDPNRRFLWSTFLKLEVLPRAVINGKKYPDQAPAFRDFFSRAQPVPVTDDLVEKAVAFATDYNLSTFDALHIVSAIAGGADEFITFEKPDNPFFRIPPTTLKVTSLYAPPQPA
jgi:predicted nucleic acid-binding protein